MFLLLQQFALTGNVAAVTLGGHILAHGLHRLAGNDLGADGGLDGNLELLAWDKLLQLLADSATEGVGIVGVNQRGERIHGIAVQENVQFHQTGGPELGDMVVEGGIALGDALQLVVEVEDDFAQRHIEGQLHAVGGHVHLVHQRAALVNTEFHNRTDIVIFGDNLSADIGLLHVVDFRGGGHSGGVIDIEPLFLGGHHLVGDIGHGGDDILVKLAVEALLDDLHMEQAEEAAAEAEAEGGG